MKLISIPADKYDDYRLDVIFDCYKWDPQFLDNNTIAKHALVISEEEHQQLQILTESLDEETRQAEAELNRNLKLAKPLALPRQLKRELKTMNNYQADRHIRLMRYDFHQTTDNKWVISEVNSDVPGGLAEASLMPKAAIKILGDMKYRYENFGDTMADAIAKNVKPQGKIMLIHCTSYSDDRQVMQFLGDKLMNMGHEIIYAAADHLRFKDNEAISILEGNEGKIDAILRFTPIEWLMKIKPKNWAGYFSTITLSCNHPIAIFAQTKRFPLVWKALEEEGLKLATWKKLLPETITVREARNKKGYIYKPVYGRVGEKISIKEACAQGEYRQIMRDVRLHPSKYLAQKKFDSKPLVSDEGKEYHVCLGAYSVNGKAAGYYARASLAPRIDSGAADIPVLIERGKNDR